MNMMNGENLRNYLGCVESTHERCIVSSFQDIDDDDGILYHLHLNFGNDKNWFFVFYLKNKRMKIYEFTNTDDFDIIRESNRWLKNFSERINSEYFESDDRGLGFLMECLRYESQKEDNDFKTNVKIFFYGIVKKDYLEII